ncbi:hypothetical protein PSU4_57060 [Pseudonocardia sulfidoxydans NBRC 16205]|uniref:(2Fe-2S) ferredoxin domain-containing protein n=1 Tax=Pseudonocardia sulfidoxydans NBRC 16205 TaxID=1223511 RepID=A0A511DPK5_9PSEU|nr:hypothetical protein PSU4_57060 [Pseudonocardia sulfidoxydans NBRC 16205]
MSFRRPSRDGAKPGRSGAPCRVTVCRGCCCGTARKHPGVDHLGQFDRIVDGVGDTGKVRASDCLDVCAQSNVVVVSPSSAGRAAGARPVWLRDVLDEDVTEGIVEWVRAGGPGVVDAPDLVSLFMFSPSRRVRSQLPG